MNIKELLVKHNNFVKDDYRVEIYNISKFREWIDGNANFDEDYIEIPSNETLSGHAEILEL